MSARERTIAGLALARAAEKAAGPTKLTPKQVCTARKMLADPEMTIKEVAEAFVSTAALPATA